MNDVLFDKFCYYNDTLNWDYCLWAFSQYLWINFKFLLKYVMYALMDCIFGIDHFS